MAPHGLWLVPRQAGEAARTRAAFAARGAQALVVPVLEPRPLDPGPIAPGIQAVLVTSRNGARALARTTLPRDTLVLAVGDATAELVRGAGFARVESAAGDAIALATLVCERLEPAAGPLLHLSGDRVSADLAPPLRRAGFALERRIAYAMEPVDALPDAARAALETAEDGGMSPAGAAFFSPRVAEVFDRVLARAGLAGHRARLVALCLSRQVAERLDPADWATIRVARQPTMAALLDLLAPEEAAS